MRPRAIGFAEAASALTQQLESHQALMDEFMKLSGGRIGLIDALLETIADEISYAPHILPTPEQLRSIVGAPLNDEDLYEWQLGFWDSYKAAKNVRNPSDESD